MRVWFMVKYNEHNAEYASVSLSPAHVSLFWPTGVWIRCSVMTRRWMMVMVVETVSTYDNDGESSNYGGGGMMEKVATMAAVA